MQTHTEFSQETGEVAGSGATHERLQPLADRMLYAWRSFWQPCGSGREAATVHRCAGQAHAENGGP
jgi:hypothetical protein